MRVFNDIQSLRAHLQTVDGAVGLVPTMGALHEGHISLIETAKSECDVVICSIFINPIQFNNEVDFQKYPVSMDRDKQLLLQKGCDILFCPSKDEMYPADPKINFTFLGLDSTMEGGHRPGHFNGVAIVVSKLFNIIQPDRAYFGLKDLQQLRVIQQLVSDLSFQLEIIPVAIKRETGGLAMSSRNRRLSKEGLIKAEVLNKTLDEVHENILLGISFDKIQAKLITRMEAEGFDVDYLELVDANTLESVLNKSENNDVAICVAASIEGVRLIDNRIF